MNKNEKFQFLQFKHFIKQLKELNAETCLFAQHIDVKIGKEPYDAEVGFGNGIVKMVQLTQMSSVVYKSKEAIADPNQATFKALPPKSNNDKSNYEYASFLQKQGIKRSIIKHEKGLIHVSDEYSKVAPGSTHRKLLADGVVSDLLTRLDGIETIQSNQLEYLVKNGVSLDYNDKTANKRIESLLSFAKTLVDSSKLFTQDVQVRSRTSIIGNHSLSIKGDFNTILWKDIANTDLSVPFWTLTPDLASIGQDFGDTILEPSVQPLVDFHDNINIKYDVVSIDNNQAYIVEGDQSFAHNRWNLEIEFSNGTRETSQAIWFNSASSTTYVTPQFNFSDNSQQLTFTNSAVPINISKININIWKNNSSIAGTQQLQQDFVDFVNKAFLDEYNKIKDKVAILQATDPNAPTAFSINIKSLTVGYQELTCTPLGNDLWSVNVNGFVDANFNIDYDIIQNPNI